MTFTLSLFFISSLALTRIENQDASEHDSYPDYVVFVPDADSIGARRLPDSIFNQRAGSTIFRVNSSQLNMSDPLIKELVDSVLPMARREEYMLVGIDLRGAASPEGYYANNQKLGIRRSQALIDLMSQHLDSVQIAQTSVTNVAADYPYLLWLLEQDDDPAAPAVRAIIERYGYEDSPNIKAALLSANGGMLWERLLVEYFPRLRAARLMLFFKHIYPQHPVYELSMPTEVLLPTCEAQCPALRALPSLKRKAQRRHVLALSTNVLYDAFYMPQFGWAPLLNAQLEFFPRSGNFTFLAGYTGSYYRRWSRQKFFQVSDYHLEVRRYFRHSDRHLGAYLGAYVNANKFGIGLSASKGWQGEGLGGALKVGYVVPLGQGRWRMDFHAAFGGYVARYDKYVYGNPITGEVDDKYYYDWTLEPAEFRKRNHRFTWIGPTELGVSVAFDLFYRKSTAK